MKNEDRIRPGLANFGESAPEFTVSPMIGDNRVEIIDVFKKRDVVAMDQGVDFRFRKGVSQALPSRRAEEGISQCGIGDHQDALGAMSETLRVDGMYFMVGECAIDGDEFIDHGGIEFFHDASSLRAIDLAGTPATTL